MTLHPRRVALSTLFSLALLLFNPLYGQTQSLERLLASARAAQSSGNYAAAAGFYREATALDPAVPELWSNRGIMEYLDGDMNAAVTSLKHALQINPDLFSPLLFLGKAYVRTGKNSLANSYLERAHSLRPKDPEALLALAKANANLGRQPEASSFYEDATRISPDNAQAWLGLGSTSLGIIANEGHSLAANGVHSPWANALYADELLQQNRPLEATDKYKFAFSSATRREKGLLARDIAWMQSHPEVYSLPSDSRDALNRLSEEFSADFAGNQGRVCDTSDDEGMQFLLTSAACDFWAGDYDGSVTAAQKVLLTSPHNAEALFWSIRAKERIAVAALSRFEELSPKSSYVLVGDLYRDERNPDRALSEYKKALALDPHDPSALMGAAACYFTRSQLGMAESTERDALAVRPLDPQLNLLMAEILTAEHKFDEAKSYLKKCQAVPPELQYRVHLLLGRADLAVGEKQEAINELELALPGDKDGSTHYMLSRLYRETGRLAQAQKTLADAKRLIQRRNANAVIAVHEEEAQTP